MSQVLTNKEAQFSGRVWLKVYPEQGTLERLDLVYGPDYIPEWMQEELTEVRPKVFFMPTFQERIAAEAEPTPVDL